MGLPLVVDAEVLPPNRCARCSNVLVHAIPSLASSISGTRLKLAAK